MPDAIVVGRVGGTRGTIKLDNATVHVELRPDSEGWVARAVIEVHSKLYGNCETLVFRASSPKEAWAAMSSEVYKQLQKFY